MIGFDDALVFISDRPQNRYYILLINSPSNRLENENYQVLRLKSLPLRDSIEEWIIGHDKPFIVHTARLVAQFPDEPGIRLMQQVGIQDSLLGLLCTGGQPIGSLHLHSERADFFQPDQLPLFQLICDQIAVAVANILATEEILEREREKALLLSLSEDMATIRDRDDLFNVIIAKIRPLIGFDEAAAVFVFDATGKNYSFLFDKVYNAHSPTEAFNRWKSNPVNLADDPVMRYMVSENKALILTVQEAIRRWGNFPALETVKELGIQEAMHAPLRAQGKLIGFLSVNSTQVGTFIPSALLLYQSIADQIAVAVANILANEEILEREQEQRLQLAVINALNAGPDWERKGFRLVQLLKSCLPFDYAVAGLEDLQRADRTFGYECIGYDEWRTIRRADFQRMAGLSAIDYTEQRGQLPLHEPLLLNGADFVAHRNRYAIQQARAQTFGLNACLLLPVALSRAGLFSLCFYARQADAYHPQHLTLVAKIVPSLALMLDKLLAYEEIAQLSERLRQENTYLQEELNRPAQSQNIIGSSVSLQAVFNSIRQVAPTDTTVLIMGESGTGKELIARALHLESARKDRALIKLNCATLPANLIESELFGHEKGAFTGAIDKRIGKFELANGGTIFLDEIGEMPLDLQAKLLRVLQEREFERLGGRSVLTTDVRIIAATNRNLEQEVAEGRFRLDLYYRLNVFPINLPPLRDRPDDIPLLAQFFARKYCQKMGKPFQGIQEQAIRELLAYNWPGNIRELENLVEQAVIVYAGTGGLTWARPLTANSLQPRTSSPSAGSSGKDPVTTQSADRQPTTSLDIDRMVSALAQTKGKVVGRNGAAELLGVRPYKLEEAERIYLMDILTQTRGRIRGTGGAAALLAVKPTTLEARMARLGIQKGHILKK